jgi:lipopolysaccharide/colanic/teichoic acid biosynthesis glycosyltransferase
VTARFSTLAGSAEAVTPEGFPECPAARALLVPDSGSRAVKWRTAVRLETKRAAARLALAAGDAAGFVAAGFCLGLAGLLHAGDWPLVGIAAACVVVLNAATGLYPGYEFDRAERLRRRTLVALSVTGLGALAMLILAQDPGAARAFALTAGLGAVLQAGLQVLVRNLLRAAGLWGERADLVVPPDLAAPVSAFFNTQWQIGIRPETPGRAATGKADARWVLLAAMPVSISDLERLCQRYERVFLLADTPFVRISGLGSRNAGGRIGICLGGRQASRVPDVLSRLIDVALAIPMLICALPVLAFAALMIRAVDPGPVIYAQEREGLNGRKIRILKLRTMYVDSEERLDALLAADPAAAREWAISYKLKNDPRILPIVGKLLRASSLDELPQLVNVLRGDMRLVGPRPFPEYHLAAMGADFRLKRRRLTPGLTGLWQVSARSDADVELQQRLDEYYIEHRSFWLDCHILLSTLRVVFQRSGAY